jgi:hypothetical protein
MSGDGGLGATIELDATSVTPGQRLGYRIVNTGTVELTADGFGVVPGQN